MLYSGRILPCVLVAAPHSIPRMQPNHRSHARSDFFLHTSAWEVDIAAMRLDPSAALACSDACQLQWAREAFIAHLQVGVRWYMGCSCPMRDCSGCWWLLCAVLLQMFGPSSVAALDASPIISPTAQPQTHAIQFDNWISQDAVRLQTPLLVGGVGASSPPALRAQLLAQLRQQVAEATARGHPVAGWFVDLPPPAAGEKGEQAWWLGDASEHCAPSTESTSDFWQAAEFERCLLKRQEVAANATRVAAAAGKGGRWWLGGEEAAFIQRASAEAASGFFLAPA